MTKVRSKAKSKKLSHNQLEKSILILFSRNPKKRYPPSRIAKEIRVKNTKEAISKMLEDLTKQGKVRKVKDGLFKHSNNATPDTPKQKGKGKLYEGTVDMTKSGAAYIVLDDKDIGDVYVPQRHLNSALNDDKVLVEIGYRPRGKKPEGKIVKVVSRSREKFIGTCVNVGSRSYVEVKMGQNDVHVDLIDAGSADHGDKVIVKIIGYSNRGIKGKVESILTSGKSHDFEMISILIENGFDIAFSKELLAAAEALSDNITEQDLAERRDMRDVTTFTIDPHDAKDFDDAISYRVLKNGDKEIGVHIADVSHYVKEGSPIDKEAALRSTSVYLVDRVCPMLPERLSNELCSLRPNEDKFTFSAVFTLNEKNRIVERWFGKTLTHSDRRFTYLEAQEIMDSDIGDLHDELVSVDKISKHFRKLRYLDGSIKFETEEVRFRLDDNNEPIDLYVKERKDAHLLVEDLMLLANKEVATYIVKKEKDVKKIPFVYRIHDQPDPEKLTDFALIAKEFGLNFRMNTPAEIAASFNAISENEDNEEYASILMPLAIRTMAKAEYSSENIGHYGLSFDNYSHFTSPIRRYADLLVHRILNKNLKKEYRVNAAALEEQCEHISKQERKATGAERESIKYMQAVYMAKHVGGVFEGRVSGIIERGIFVELLESRAEGMIPFKNIGKLLSVNSGWAILNTTEGEVKFKFGQHLKVRLDEVDIDKRQLNLSFPTE